jgi:hypothetical protein
MGVSGQLHAPAALSPAMRPATNCIGGWMGPRAILDWSGKSRLHLGSIPGPPVFVNSRVSLVETFIWDKKFIVCTNVQEKMYNRTCINAIPSIV